EAESIPIAFHGERADALGTGIAGTGHDEIELGLAGVGDEPLRSVEHVPAGRGVGPAPERRGVAPARGLRQRVGTQPSAGEEVRQIPRLPVLGAADGRGYALGHEIPNGADDLALFAGEPEVAIHAHKHATLGPFNGPGYACSPCACTTR